MLVKVSKKGFLRKSLDAGLDILKGKNIERAVEKKDRMTATMNKLRSTSKFDKNKGEAGLRRYQELANKHDSRIRKETLRTNVARGGLFGGIAVGTAHGLGDAAKREEEKMYAAQPKLAAVEFSNIPKDTSKPTTQSPTDGMDYYDYQEWVAAETGNAPDRTNLPVLGDDEKNAPLKIAHELGCDLFVVNAIEEYLGKREIIKEAGYADDAAVAAIDEAKDEFFKKNYSTEAKFKKSWKNSRLNRKGSKLLGAALVAGGAYGVARGAANIFSARPDFRHDWYN